MRNSEGEHLPDYQAVTTEGPARISERGEDRDEDVRDAVLDAGHSGCDDGVEWFH